ncbi:GH116 family glycosyl hydrolase [Chryseolinea sp. H1M3-3]|uniref:GH116 family glycosyl hydrolase n=1 Tax=Chryseolinea sp. H1M3-3 TaxID=3034144 RepID=UPI0023EBFAE0|nr:GH116 family glycosyl hydrolase [Chryseolinea sp. H1M3-3]
MKTTSNRRSFLKKISVGSVSATVMPAALLAREDGSAANGLTATKPILKQEGRVYNGSYHKEFLKRVAFPIGGMGAGMFCLEGNGAISHMSVRSKPDVFNEPGMFGAISVKGIKNGAKVIEGPVPEWKSFGQPNTGNGAGGSIFGLPRFENPTFLARFPFATISLQENDYPLQIELTGWSPFFPNDADNSSLPVGALAYKFKNISRQSVECVFSFHSKNFMKPKEADQEKNKAGKNYIQSIPNGFILSQAGTESRPHDEGDFAIFTDASNTIVDHCWFRGGWFDPLTMTWEAIRKGEIKQVDPVESGAPGASLFVPFTINAGEEKTIAVMMGWYVPVSDMRHGGDAKEEDKCDGSSGCCATSESLGAKAVDQYNNSENYKPWYSSRFKNIQEISEYWTKNYDDLFTKSTLFSDTFYANSLPPEVTEAIAANLTILKSPTVMRQHDGRLWNYEGCGDAWGCCHGSCTHVWNYAQAIPHLFPALERTLRHTEFCENQSKSGHQTFRAALPIRPVDHSFYAAADGQLGGIMKVYRDWRIYGNNDWLKTMYPMVKKSLDYCISTWDPKGKGVIEEPHHNTYDIEFWGPDGMCTSFYLGALTAIIQMGKFLKKPKDVAVYQNLLEKGKKFIETELYNGEYFYQKIQVEGLNAPNPILASEKSMGGHYSDEARQLLEKEGPKYQYGTGCLSDGVLGAWITKVAGLDDPFDGNKIKSHLLAVYKYNFKSDLSEHANPQRPSFALGNEGGLLLCSWPKGGKLSLPFVYSDEVWTGIEYQVASHLIFMGNVKEGLEIVRACRDRYDGTKRNPFNEYECGHWYARALSSYGLLQGLTGVRYDAVEKVLHIDSKIGDFASFLSTATGFGTVALTDGKVSLTVAHGQIPVKKINLAGKVSNFES